MKGLARDSQLWKSAYYDQFVRPRASRIPGLRDGELSAKSLYYSSKISRWLDDDYLVKRGRATNWKLQYKLRHNWSRGNCKVSETQVAERASIPPLLVRLYEGIVVTVDSAAGLRAWRMKGEQQLLASTPILSSSDPGDHSFAPTSLAIDSSNSSPEEVGIAVGFMDGRFSIHHLSMQERNFAQKYTHVSSSNGTISAIAYASPYLLTMTDVQLLSLYCFDSRAESKLDQVTFSPPGLLSSLKSHTAWPPLSLTIRTVSTNILASIVYAMPTYLAGWSVGLQELRLTSEGVVLESRLASALDQGFAPLTMPRPSPLPDSRILPQGRGNDLGVIAPSSKPTTISYTHPYLLAAHADNTLTLYMVTSNAHNLSIGTGHRLWGHTSSVSGAYVGDRGKAVSVSKHGNELRVWELEGGISSSTSRRRIAAGAASVRIRPEKSKTEKHGLEDDFHHGTWRGTRFGVAAGHDVEEVATTKGWVGFDEEKVIVLREKTQGAQTLVVYDFT